MLFGERWGEYLSSLDLLRGNVWDTVASAGINLICEVRGVKPKE